MSDTMTLLVEQMNEIVERYRTPIDQARATAERLGRVLEAGGALEHAFTRTCPEHYARYKMYKHPDDRFCIVAMVWGPRQGTCLHDHGGVWCVEGVYRGQMHIVRYDLDGMEGDLYRFHAADEVVAGLGEVGNLVPPSEYHVMENRGDTPAISLHVYGQELAAIHRFHPTGDGLYRRERVALCYDGEAG